MEGAVGVAAAAAARRPAAAARRPAGRDGAAAGEGDGVTAGSECGDGSRVEGGTGAEAVAFCGADQRAADEFDEFYLHFDMLCDGNRNAVFEAALQRTIRRMHEKKASVHVLDIGTGSGLLALLANRHGADAVTAVECVPKLADIAELHFKRHGAAVRLLRGCSRDLDSWPEAAPDDSQSHSSKPNLVVAELLETGLLGEGMLPTMRHAAAHLLAPGFAVIPAATRIYAILIRGSVLRESETVPGQECGPGACTGAAAPWHVHTEAMRQKGLISYMSDAFEVFDFEWGSNLPGPEGRSLSTVNCNINANFNRILY